jgi:hypothetical protein
MVLDKNSQQADAAANLYRSALFLARGSRKVGLEFLSKAKQELGIKLEPVLEGRADELYWAEKILDQYHQIRF